MQKITKRFPGVLANDQVSLTVASGEVHALLGENGAGKTTLMSILYGLYQPDEGVIEIAGKPLRFSSPRDAMRAGVGLVAQHFLLARRHSVAENIALGLQGTPWLLPTRKLRHQISELSERYQFAVHPDAPVWQLSAGEQQRVEILKALVRGAEILILDEPTSVLTPQEAEQLFGVVRQMKSEGKGIIFITHKLAEVMAVADQITVLRQGASVGSVARDQASEAQLAQMMVGEAIEPVRSSSDKVRGKPVLHVSELHAPHHRGGEALKGVSFTLHQGEILGVAGVAGNGQSELIEVLTGLRQASQGEITLAGQRVSRYSARQLFEAGVAHIPEDRHHMGIVPAMSLAANVVLRQYRYAPFAKGGVIDWRAVDRFARRAIDSYQVAAPSHRVAARLLSGGNIQKLILARELSGDPKVIVAAHPTHGLDVRAAEQTHALLLAQRDKGAGVMLVSEDLDELLKLSDRIAVIFSGQLMGVLERARASREVLGQMMAGMALPT